MTIRMDTSQVAAVAKRLAAMGAMTEPSVSKVVQASVRALADKARERAPVDTGALKGSIHPRVYFGLSGAVQANIRYAGYVEYGTSFTPAQPFMGPALEEEAPDFFASAAEAAYEILRTL